MNWIYSYYNHYRISNDGENLPASEKLQSVRKQTQPKVVPKDRFKGDDTLLETGEGREKNADIVFLSIDNGSNMAAGCSWKKGGTGNLTTNFTSPSPLLERAICKDTELKVLFVQQTMCDSHSSNRDSKSPSTSPRAALSSAALKKRSAWKSATNNRQQHQQRHSSTSEEGNCNVSSTESGCVFRAALSGSQECEAANSNFLQAERDQGNLLKVPSPSGGRSPLYSTSPSTDEGIVTDDLHPDEGTLLMKEKDSALRMETKSRCASPRISKSRGSLNRHRFQLSEDANGNQPEVFLKNDYKISKPEQRSDLDPNNNSNHELVPLVCAPRNPVGHQQARNLVTTYSGKPHSNQKSVTAKRVVYKKRGPCISDTVEASRLRCERNLEMGAAHSASRIRGQQHHRGRQMSVGSTPTRREATATWRQTPGQEYNPDLSSDEDDSPVVVYSRPPSHKRQMDTRMLSLFEETDPFQTSSKPDTKSQPELSTSNQTAIDTGKVSGTSGTRDAVKLQQPLEQTNQQNLKPESVANPPKSDAVPTSVARQTSVTSRNESTPPFLSSGSLAKRTVSRSGSVKSALVDAVSHVVGATSSRNLLPKNMTPKEKQQTLSERLMTVGPSDPRRVQSIVEDILCEMGEERIVQYKNAFAKFDKDSSGIISSKQLRRLLRTLGHNPSDIELRELVNQVDMDENGKIDFNEFIIMIGYFDKANNEDEDLCNIFRVFDREQRGCIDVNELRNIWNDFLTEMAPMDEFEEMIDFIDNDHNGEINRVELLEMLSTR
uniref:Uncharacterized protein LOC100175312 n=1 Tax=Phallusia mammillata TaxID=59560 RepID=A0A6F9DGG5_9ASCI|nr:uncharacterized protein LOC100175312 [Phallusia mammillata]